VTKYVVGPPPPHHQGHFYGTSRQPRKLIFGMQPYFDPTRKTTSKKMEDNLNKNKKWKTTSKKMNKGRQPYFFFEKLE
jgi:hypothetical protein